MNSARRAHSPTFRTLSVACAFVLSANAASAVELTGVLRKVKDSGQITIGYRESSIPFSYLDDEAQPVGYTLELCNRVVDAVKSEGGVNPEVQRFRMIY